MYELHVCQNGTWKRLRAFEARQDAMSTSIELERGRNYSGVEIFELAFDPKALENKKKLIHRWSLEEERKAESDETDTNIERQRQERRKIRDKRKIAREKQKKQIRNYIALTGLAVTLLFGLAFLSALPSL